MVNVELVSWGVGPEGGVGSGEGRSVGGGGGGEENWFDPDLQVSLIDPIIHCHDQRHTPFACSLKIPPSPTSSCKRKH